MTEQPQDTIYAVVHEEGGEWVPRTDAPSGRWAFKSLNPAAERAHRDRHNATGFKAKNVRLAKYRFDGWV